MHCHFWHTHQVKCLISWCWLSISSDKTTKYRKFKSTATISILYFIPFFFSVVKRNPHFYFHIFSEFLSFFHNPLFLSLFIYVSIGRKKYGSLGGGKKKKLKWLYPVLIGIGLTKMFMFPLFLKAVTIMSSAAFVFSKMSLLASIILGLKFFLTNNRNNNDSKVEIVHVPLKKYGGGDWDREASDAKLHNVFADNIYDHDLRPTRFVL